MLLQIPDNLEHLDNLERQYNRLALENLVYRFYPQHQLRQFYQLVRYFLAYR